MDIFIFKHDPNAYVAWDKFRAQVERASTGL
jgi:hypothetical protein